MFIHFCRHWNTCDVVGHAIFASIRLYASIHGRPRAANRASCGHSESIKIVSIRKKNMIMKLDPQEMYNQDRQWTTFSIN